MHLFRLQSGVRVHAEHAQPVALRAEETPDRADLNGSVEVQPKRLEFRPGATGLGDVLRLDVEQKYPESSPERNANFHATRNPTTLIMEEL